MRAALLRDGRITGAVGRAPFATRRSAAGAAEVNPADLLAALQKALAQVPRAARAEAIVPAVMAPAIAVMDRAGKTLFPIITHQDRRSIAEATQIEKRIGPERHLQLTGNRPFPGGIGSTTLLWLNHHAPGLMRRADLVGQLNTWLQRTLCGTRVIDPSNASFTGLYHTLSQQGWSKQLCAAAGVCPALLPAVLQANAIGGRLSRSAAAELGLPQDMPMLVGLMDGSAAMLAAGVAQGQMLHVCGSTDVLAVCTARPMPHAQLLTRCLGIGKWYLSVSTLAAAGMTLDWAKRQWFEHLSATEYGKLLWQAAGEDAGGCHFEPYLAGDRMSLQPRTAALTGLTLATNPRHILAAIVRAMASSSRGRFALLRQINGRIKRRVVLSGGAQPTLGVIMHQAWGRACDFAMQKEATLRGAGMLLPAADPL